MLTADLVLSLLFGLGAGALGYAIVWLFRQ